MWGSYQQLDCVAKQSASWDEEKQATVSPCSQSQAVGWEADSGGHMWDDVVSVTKTISPRSISGDIILFSCHPELVVTGNNVFASWRHEWLFKGYVYNVCESSVYPKMKTTLWERLSIVQFSGIRVLAKERSEKRDFPSTTSLPVQWRSSTENYLHPYHIKDSSLRFLCASWL